MPFVMPRNQQIVAGRVLLQTPSARPKPGFGVFFSLVNLLLLVDGELAGAAVDEQQETADNREDLEEVVLGEVLVGVVLVELGTY